MTGDDTPDPRMLALESAVDAFHRSGDTMLEADACRRLGRLQLGLQQGDAGFVAFQRAAELYTAAGETHLAGEASFGCAAAKVTLGLDEESLEWFARTVERFDECDDLPNAVEAERRLLEVLNRLRRWEEPDRARRVVARTIDADTSEMRVARLEALRYLVGGQYEHGDFRTLAATAREAAQASDLLGERAMQIRFINTAGYGLRKMEHYSQAADEFEHVLALIRRWGDTEDLEAETIEQLVELFKESPETGEERLRRYADTYAAEGNARMEAQCRFQLAQCIELAGRTRRDECATEYARAAELYDRVDRVGDAGHAWLNAAFAYFWLSMEPLIGKPYREVCYTACVSAAERLEAVGDWWAKGMAEQQAGQLAMLTLPSEPKDPRSLLMWRRSIHSLERAGRLVEAAHSRVFTAYALIDVGTPQEWMDEAVAALRSYETARAGLLIPHDRDFQDTEFNRALRSLIRQAGTVPPSARQNPRWAELVWLLQQVRKARTFVDQQAHDSVWSSFIALDATLQDLTQQIEILRLQQTTLTRKIDARFADRAISVEDMQALKDQQDQNKSKLQQLEWDLRNRAVYIARELPDLMELDSVSPISPTELQGCLHPGEAYLDFLYPPGGFITRSTATRETFSVIVAGESFEQFVQQATDAGQHGDDLSNMDRPADAARLVGSIPDGVDTLIVSPDELLVGMPWHLLPWPTATDPTQTLGERYTIAVIPAAGTLHHLRTTRSHSPKAATYLGVACDGRGSDQALLACVDDEVSTIGRDYFSYDPGSRFFTTKDCHQFVQSGCSVRLLHLSCHAERHGLLLSCDGTWTTPVDLLNQPNRTFGADILLLTGCRAGDLAGQRANNGFLGIARQLIVATGAQAAVVSVASVPDAAGAVFADLLTSALTGRNPDRPWTTPPQPLAVGPAVTWARQTMRELRGHEIKQLVPNAGAQTPPERRQAPRPEHPKWWSPWFVIGDPRAALNT